MHFKTLEQFEDQKGVLQENYERNLTLLYRRELIKIFAWFKKKFPKRKLKWTSGMGTGFWVLDDEILHWEFFNLDNRGYSTVWHEANPDRVQRVLYPLWNFQKSIQDMTNCSSNWIDTGDFTMEDTK